MSFTAVQIQFLHRLAAERPVSRRAGDVARFFCENYSLGVVVGNQVEYHTTHHEAARRLLGAHELPREALGPNATRADAAAFGGMSEKTLSAAPHLDSVAVKVLGDCTLDGHALYTPEGAYCVLTKEQAQRVTCQRLLVVENLETFRTLEAYSWIDARGLGVLAVYRGDNVLPNKDAAEVLQARTEPIWSFFDFDPAGLAMASALPSDRLERVVMPSSAWLEQAANTSRGRQLFDSQASIYEKVLEDAKHPDIRALWFLMKRLRSAVTQERMRRADVFGNYRA